MIFSPSARFILALLGGLFSFAVVQAATPETAKPKTAKPQTKAPPGQIEVHKFPFQAVDTTQDNTPSFFGVDAKVEGAPCLFTGVSYFNMTFFGVLVTNNKRRGDQVFVGGVDIARTIKLKTNALWGKKRADFAVLRTTLHCVYKSNNADTGLVLFQFRAEAKQKPRFAVVQVAIAKKLSATVVGTVSTVQEAKNLAAQRIPDGTFKLKKSGSKVGLWKSFYGTGFQEFCPFNCGE